ncbi:MAG: hypothetical protein ACOCXY_03180 [Planctomycetota bacterium]
MVDATVLVFDRKGACWEWEETFPAVPRVGETLCFEELEGCATTGLEVRCTISEVQWRCDEQVSLLLVADVEENTPGDRE